MAERSRGAAKTKGSIGCLFWLAAIIVVILLFLINLGKIRETLEKTNFNEIVRRERGPETSAGAPVENAPRIEDEAGSPRGGSEAPDSLKPGAELEEPSARNGVPSPAQDSGSSQTSTAPAKSGDAQQEAPRGGDKSKPAPVQPGTAQPTAIQPRSRLASLYFVRIDDNDGVMARIEVKRQVPASDSPLTDAIEALLKGPTEDELRRKLISLVPGGTKLLGATVRGSTAFLNFSEDFMYNHYGIEGYAGQLKQVVYTATSFPTVQDVQILIEGAKRDYLGGEGVRIGYPLSRNSF